MKTVNDNENHLTRYRIIGLPWPYDPSEATNKFYVDQQIGSGGGVSGILDCGSPSSFGVGIPIIDCGGIT